MARVCPAASCCCSCWTSGSECCPAGLQGLAQRALQWATELSSEYAVVPTTLPILSKSWFFSSEGVMLDTE